MARSLRTILGAAGMKLKHRFALDIVEAEIIQNLPSSSIKRVPSVSDSMRKAKQRAFTPNNAQAAKRITVAGMREEL